MTCIGLLDTTLNRRYLLLKTINLKRWIGKLDKRYKYTQLDLLDKISIYLPPEPADEKGKMYNLDPSIFFREMFVILIFYSN